MRRPRIFSLLAVLALIFPCAGSERDALAISARIRQLHLPYGTILDPVYSAWGSNEVSGYSRCGDSALWTGHYLAAEAFRYRVTGAPDALQNASAALGGLELLAGVPGTGLLARCAVPADSPYAAGIAQEEATHGVYPGNFQGRAWQWIGNTSRDQYSGVFFGLGVAYDLIEDSAIRSRLSALATRLLNPLLDNGWAVRMPNGSMSTSFAARPDQQLTLLQIGRRVNSDAFSFSYNLQRFFSSGAVGAPISIDVMDDHGAYFKFNLDTINLYNLVRLESSGYRSFYESAYDLLRRTTDDHQNAHFNMIDRALKGPSAARDEATREYLRDWLLRPKRDPYVDLRGRFAACGNDRACAPIPVEDRIATDFLWQRSPFLLYGGAEGRIEGAGVDYILPYWMGRYYGVIPAGPQPPAVVNRSGAGGVTRAEIWDPDGYDDVALALLVANPDLAAANSCYFYYAPALSSVWLATDSGNSWLGPASLGGPAQLANNRCSIDLSRSSEQKTGETIRLDLALTFSQGSATRKLYVYAQDAAGRNTGWQETGGAPQ